MFNHNFLYEDPVIQYSQTVFGINYPYPWQRLIIAAVLDAVLPNSDSEVPPEPLRRIAVLPTGAGKSLCWMLPAAMMDGLSVAVFPLLSLMSDQERRLREAGVVSVTLRGGQTPAERRNIWALLESGGVKIVLANPEVLQVDAVGRRLSALKPAFLVVDETHTVSQWGESFRPACAGIGRLVEDWNPKAVLALTATAGPTIRDRITELLFNGEKPTEALADPDRPSIKYGVIPTLSRNHLLERLARVEPRPIVVFGATRSSVEMAARMLRFRLKNDEIRYYHAGLSREEKSRLEEWFLASENGVLCATCAYGMGVDKANVRTVVHLSPPSSVEAYLQESGRASRDGNGANAWLIWTPEDMELPAAVGNISADLRGGSKKDKVNGRLREAVPDRDSGKQGAQKVAGASPAPPECTAHSAPATDAEAIAAARRAAMVRYATSTNCCRREMLLEALGIEALDCTGCDVCGGEAWTVPPEREVIQKVVRWNRGRFRKGQLARILIGRRTAEIRRAGLDLARGFGALSGWELEDAEEAVNTLMGTGEIRYRKWGSPDKIYPGTGTPDKKGVP